jgi:hypothetical protein
VSIHDKIRAFLDTMGEHHRYRSWEHCFGYFRRHTPEAIAADLDQAALQLGFYLASWGMYRGSSFLLQYTYTIHRGVIELLLARAFSPLWEREFGAGEHDGDLAPLIMTAAEAVRYVYRPFASAVKARAPSDTLVTKVLLGILGCLPACDRYFIEGFKSTGFQYSYLNSNCVERVLGFCRGNIRELTEEQQHTSVQGSSGLNYPLMKLVDMYFWQIGYEHGVTDSDVL